MLTKRIFYPFAFIATLSLSFISCGGNSAKSAEDAPADSANIDTNTVVTKVTDSINGYAVADLGLSVRWATDNVGGDNAYYAWGEIETKEVYKVHNSAWGLKSLKANGVVDKSNLIAKYDVATQQWGNPWRMPTIQEIRELINKCQWDFVTLNDSINGYRVTGPNGNSIFLAANGFRSGKKIKDYNVAGRYWSATHGSGTSSRCLDFNISYSTIAVTDELRYFGMSVRAVTE